MEHTDIQIAVLGATGKTGRPLIQILADMGIAVKGLTRTAAKAPRIQGVDWTEGDQNDDDTLKTLLNGCTGLFLNTAIQQDMAALQANIIDLAKAAGISHIIKLSTPSASSESKEPVGRQHWEAQEYLKASGVDWNILQPQSFMQNWFGNMAESVRGERKIYEAAGDGKRPFIDTRDIAEVAAVLFKDAGSFKNRLLPLSGPAAISYYDVADALSRALGETVTYIPQSPEEARERYMQKGAPEWAINTFIAIALNQKSGAAEKMVSDTVEKVLGRRGKDVYAFAQDFAAIFK